MYGKEISKAYESIEPGIVYRVHTNNEIIPHVTGYKYKVVFWDGFTQTLSDNGNRFITKISICTCGKRKEDKMMRNPLCQECMDIASNEKYRQAYHDNKNKPKTKSAKQIAFEITGYYPRVEREIDWEELSNKLDNIAFNRYLQTRQQAA